VLLRHCADRAEIYLLGVDAKQQFQNLVQRLESPWTLDPASALGN
jgi:hypothetical protein